MKIPKIIVIVLLTLHVSAAVMMGYPETQRDIHMLDYFLVIGSCSHLFTDAKSTDFNLFKLILCIKF